MENTSAAGLPQETERSYALAWQVILLIYPQIVNWKARNGQVQQQNAPD